MNLINVWIIFINKFNCFFFIPALVYELLYDRVFGSGEQVTIARKLLRKSDTIYPKEYMQIKEYDDFGWVLELNFSLVI